MRTLCRLSLCIALGCFSAHSSADDIVCPPTFGPVSYEFWQQPVQAPPGWSGTGKQGSNGSNKLQPLVGAAWEKRLDGQASTRFTCNYANVHAYQGVKDTPGGFGMFLYAKSISALKCSPAYPQNWRSGGVWVDNNRKPYMNNMVCGDRVRSIDPQACKLVCKQ
jgi:hypothetical protein